jgi:predicted ATP-grasp superfamily ATP-dependent carboligase
MNSTLSSVEICNTGSIAEEATSRRPIKKVLLLDGYSTRTLACVRSWGRMGIEFVVGGETRWDMSLFSRYAKEKCIYTSPKQDVSKFIRDVNAYCRQFAADHVLPTSEAAIMACSEYENELEAAPIIPSKDEIRTVFSKMNTLRIAQSLGIPVPDTLHITSKNFLALRTAAPKFPVVIKSESSEVMLPGRAATSGKTFYALNQSELEKECESRLAKGQSLLLQEFIDGYGVGVSGLFSKGRPVVLIGHRRIRESNPMGGPSAVAESVEIDSDLLKATASLLGQIGFTGPAMVEFKVDRRTGQAYLMEINGRFWGSILLALASGLDLPYLYWKMLNGIPILDKEKQYEVGVIGRNSIGDTKCLLLCLKGKQKGWPGELASRGTAIKSYCRSFVDARTKELILAGDDPMPFFARLMQAHS